MRLGVRYSPELLVEDRAPEDAKLMKRAGLNAACVGPAMWDIIEPSQGRFTYDWLDTIVEALHAQSIAVFVCIPINSPPAWAFAKYPDLSLTDVHGQSCGFGGALCYSSASIASLSEGITRALAGQYGKHEALSGWRIESSRTSQLCYCESCEQAFRDWLIERYLSEKALSDAWCVRYRAWSEIGLPRGPQIHPSHALDFARFQSHTRFAFFESVRSILGDSDSDLEIICDLDLAHDSAADPDDESLFAAQTNTGSTHWIDTAMAMAAVRPKSDRMTLAEVAGHHADPSAGALRRWIWQGIASGADRVFSGCWHSPRSGLAMGMNGLLTPDGRAASAFKEVRRTSDELTKVLPKLKNTRVEPKIAMLIQRDADLTVTNATAFPDPGADSVDRDWYEAIKQIGHGCDIVSPGCPLESYKLVLAPWLPFVDDELAEQLEQYVKGGGRLILGPGSGTRTVSNTFQHVAAPGLLLPIAGATIEETLNIPPDEPMTINFARGALIAQRAVVSGRVDVLDRMTSQAVGEYVGSRFAGKAAITRYELEKGEVHYVGAHLPQDTLCAFLTEVAPDYPMKKIPEGVEITERRGKDKRIVFILNHTPDRQTVTLPKACLDLLANEKVGPEVTLSANGVLILRS